VGVGVSHCQIEVDVSYAKLHCFGLEEKSDIAPLRVLSFDIECAGRKASKTKEHKFCVCVCVCMYLCL
jgi:hypothetical protein